MAKPSAGYPEIIATLMLAGMLQGCRGKFGSVCECVSHIGRKWLY